MSCRFQLKFQSTVTRNATAQAASAGQPSTTPPTVRRTRKRSSPLTPTAANFHIRALPGTSLSRDQTWRRNSSPWEVLALLTPAVRARNWSGTSTTLAWGEHTSSSRRILKPTGRSSRPRSRELRQRKKPASGSELALASTNRVRTSSRALRDTKWRKPPASPSRLPPGW